MSPDAFSNTFGEGRGHAGGTEREESQPTPHDRARSLVARINALPDAGSRGREFFVEADLLTFLDEVDLLAEFPFVLYEEHEQSGLVGDYVELSLRTRDAFPLFVPFAVLILRWNPRNDLKPPSAELLLMDQP